MRSHCSTPASELGVEPPGEKTLDCLMQGVPSSDLLWPPGLWVGAASYSVSPRPKLGGMCVFPKYQSFYKLIH